MGSVVRHNIEVDKTIDSLLKEINLTPSVNSLYSMYMIQVAQKIKCK